VELLKQIGVTATTAAAASAAAEMGADLEASLAAGLGLPGAPGATMAPASVTAEVEMLSPRLGLAPRKGPPGSVPAAESVLPARRGRAEWRILLHPALGALVACHMVMVGGDRAGRRAGGRAGRQTGRQAGRRAGK
jgi:hypothetical protein